MARAPIASAAMTPMTMPAMAPPETPPPPDCALDWLEVVPVCELRLDELACVDADVVEPMTVCTTVTPCCTIAVVIYTTEGATLVVFVVGEAAAAAAAAAAVVLCEALLEFAAFALFEAASDPTPVNHTE